MLLPSIRKWTNEAETMNIDSLHHLPKDQSRSQQVVRYGREKRKLSRFYLRSVTPIGQVLLGKLNTADDEQRPDPGRQLNTTTTE